MQMFTTDPLYGPTDLPSWVRKIVFAPEVQRLRGVRLLNSSSPTLAALSDARRYTHTLGVARLALRWISAHPDERDSAKLLVAAALCHDLGTPPFGHVFEYLLKVQWGWSHEQAVGEILSGSYRPEGKYHQILPGAEPGLAKVLVELGIEPGEVAELARGNGRLAPLIAGTMDFDNIDNVHRMAHLLGIRGDHGESATRLAGAMSLSGSTLVFPLNSVDRVGHWASLRRVVYEILAFEETNIQGQAMLTEALVVAMENGLIAPEHWYWTDEELLARLRQFSPTKQIAQRFLAGDLYETVFIGWYGTKPSAVDWRAPENRGRLADYLSTAAGFRCVPYVFHDSGTFSKNIDAQVAEGGTISEMLGLSRSSSVIVGVVTPRRSHTARARNAVIDALEQFGFHRSDLSSIPLRTNLYGTNGQVSLPF